VIVRGDTADLLVRVGAVHTFDETAPPVTAFAVRDGAVVAAAGGADADELLREWRGPRTAVIDDPGLVVLPGFVDTHCHLVLAARSVFGVPASQARDIAGLVELIRQRAASTPAGQWIVTAANWHEFQLAERRLPTALELDAATTGHPVLVLRGGHNAVVNSAGLRLAGIDRDTPEAPGGFIGRDAAGDPTGWLQDAAMAPVFRVLPPTTPEVLGEGMVRTSQTFAAHGLTTVRDPAVSPQEWLVYRELGSTGRLAVRSYPMIMSTPQAIADAGSVSSYVDSLEARGITPGSGDGLVRLWGLKFVLDGGAEAAACLAPYANRPDYFGELLWDPDDLAEALATCVRRGWPVGTHAFGDRAVNVVLDAISAVIEREGPLRPGMLVVEHGGMISPERIAQAARLGVHITAQQALVTGLAEAFAESFGARRVAGMFPFRELLDAGAWVSAGTDHPIGPVDPLACVHGMTTRAEHAIGRTEALRLYTVAGARFLGREPLGVGAPADFVAFRGDPLTCSDEDLLTLRPELTVLGGQFT
jgi:predicted amidohydrolase YtcJ